MNEVVMEWESVVNRVAKCELGEKMIVCGRAARWWDEQIKDRINARQEVYRKVVNGREDLWDMGVKGRMWRVIKKMYMSSRSAVLLDGEKSDSFNVEQGVAQGCSLSPILFSIFISDLLKEVEQAELGIQSSSGKKNWRNVVCR